MTCKGCVCFVLLPSGIHVLYKSVRSWCTLLINSVNVAFETNRRKKTSKLYVHYFKALISIIAVVLNWEWG